MRGRKASSGRSSKKGTVGLSEVLYLTFVLLFVLLLIVQSGENEANDAKNRLEATRGHQLAMDEIQIIGEMQEHQHELPRREKLFLLQSAHNHDNDKDGEEDANNSNNSNGRGFSRWRTSFSECSSVQLLKKGIIKRMVLTNVVEDAVDIEAYDSAAGHYQPVSTDQDVDLLFTRSTPDILSYRISKDDIEGQERLLQLTGRLFSSSTALLINSHPITIVEPGKQNLDKDGSLDGATGLNIWDGAIALAKYLEKHSTTIVSGKSILELGAGTGVVGIAAALLDAHDVLLTDLPYALDNLRHNVQLNLRESTVAAIQSLDWTSSSTYPIHRAWDLIIGADVIWLAHLVPSLVQVINACAADDTSVIIAHQTRSIEVDQLFFRLMHENFDMQQVPTDLVYTSFLVLRSLFAHQFNLI